MYQELGEYQTSLKCHEKADSIWKLLYGTEAVNPNIATTYRDIGKVHLCLENYSNALEYCNKSLSMFASLCTDETKDLDLALCYSCLGDVYLAESDYEKSLCSYKQFLQIMLAANVTGVEVADTYSRIGSIYRQNGDNSISLEYHELSVAVLLSLNQDTTCNLQLAKSLGGLAIIQTYMGHYKMSLENNIQALNIQKTIYGAAAPHPSIAETYRQLGITCYEYGRYHEALDYLQQAVDINKTVYGSENHTNIAACFNAIACIYSYMADYAKAIGYYNKTAEITKVLHSQNFNQYWIASPYCSMAHVFLKIGENLNALEYSLKALNISYNLFGHSAKCAVAGASLHVIGGALNALGNYEKSLEFAWQALDIRKTVYGANHHLISATMTSIGNTYRSMGKYTLALKHYHDALNMSTTYFVHSTDSTHINRAELYNNIGNVLFMMGSFSSSMQYFERAIETVGGVKGLESLNHPSVAEAYNNIGNVCLRYYKDPNLAMSYYTDALIIATQHGKCTVTVVSVLHSLAEAWQEIGNENAARELLRIAQEKTDDSRKIEFRYILGKCYLKHKNFVKAWDHLAYALSGYQSLTLCNQTMCKLSKTRVLIGQLLLTLGRVSESLEQANLALELTNQLLEEKENATPEYKQLHDEATSLHASLTLIKICQHKFANFKAPFTS